MQLCIGTSLAIIIPTTIRSYVAHRARGAVMPDVLRIWMVPMVLGVGLGSVLAAFAPQAVFKVVFVLLAGLIAARLLFGLGIRHVGKTVAVLGLGLNVGAYGSEVVRGAIQSVPRGQWEASTALNMTRPQMLRRIILPQAFVAMVPPWGNLFIELLKSTALVSLITLGDLAFRAQQMNQTTMRTIPIFTLVLLIYLAISLAITIGMRSLEGWLGQGLARGRGAR